MTRLHEVVEDGERDDDGEEDGRAVRDDEDGGDDRSARDQPDADRHRDVHVERVDVLREAVHDPPDRRRVEKDHRRAQHARQHVGVQAARGGDTADRDGERLAERADRCNHHRALFSFCYFYFI